MTANKQSLPWAAVLVTLALPVISASAQSQPPPSVSSGTPQISQPSENPLRLDASVNYSYDGATDASFQGFKRDSDAQSVVASAGARIPVSDQWFVPVRIGYHDINLGTVTASPISPINYSMPIPGEIQTMNLDAGIGYHPNDRWTFSLTGGPRLYRLDDISGDDFGLGLYASATFKCTSTLTFIFGLGYESGRDIPVLPGAGLRWDINPKLTLDLMFPRTALVYHVIPQCDLFVGESANFAVFRADSNQGTQIGQPAFNNALGTYHEIHLGAGVEYYFCKAFSLEVQGGGSFWRELDYHSLNQEVSFAPGPYVQTALRFRF